MNEALVGRHCFGCLPKRTSIVSVRRKKCTQKQAHKPDGPIVPHAHVRQAVRSCRDCGTLVVG